MKRFLFCILSTSILILFFSSCATIPFEAKDRNIEKIASLLEKGDVDKLTGISNLPFLLDGEIILMQGDIYTLWENAVGSGFIIDDPRIIGQNPVDDQSHSIFAESMEVKAFFSKFVPVTAAIVSIPGKATGGNAADMYMILNRGKMGNPHIIGFTIR
jgi:hypothetical protein